MNMAQVPLYARTVWDPSQTPQGYTTLPILPHPLGRVFHGLPILLLLLEPVKCPRKRTHKRSRAKKKHNNKQHFTPSDVFNCVEMCKIFHA